MLNEPHPALTNLIAQTERQAKIRVAIALPDGRSSAVWSIFSRRDSVYLCSAPFGYSAHVSLHGDERGGERSRWCRVGYTDTYHKKHFGAETPRKDFCRWQREQTPASGLLQVLSLRFPLEHIAGPAKRGTSKKPLITYEAHGADGEMAELGIYFSKMAPSDSGVLLAQVGKPIGYFKLSSGEHVAVAVRLGKFAALTLPDGRPLAAGMRLPTQLLMSQDKDKLINAESLGMVVFNEPRDGELLVLMEVGDVLLSRGD